MSCMEEYDDRTYPHNRRRALCQRTQPAEAGAAWRLTLDSGLVSCAACLREHSKRIESDLERAVFELRRARADARRPGTGIGAVIAMVAAARMVRGGWMDQGQMVGRGLQPRGVRHWGFGPDEVRSSRSAACGDFWTDECFDNPWQQYDDSTAALSSVDCPDCLAIARKAGILKESNP